MSAPDLLAFAGAVATGDIEVIDLELNAEDEGAARAEIERMCEQLLANSLIESYEIEVAAQE